MARTPEELRNKLSERDKAVVDAVEAEIDAEMDRSCDGEKFVFTPSVELGWAHLRELERRYDSWHLRWRSVAQWTPNQWPFHMVLTFRPKESDE